MRNHLSFSALDGPWYLLQKHLFQYVAFFFVFFDFSSPLVLLLKPELAGTPAHNTVQDSVVTWQVPMSQLVRSDMMLTTLVPSSPHAWSEGTSMHAWKAYCSHEWKTCMSAHCGHTCWFHKNK